MGPKDGLYHPEYDELTNVAICLFCSDGGTKWLTSSEQDWLAEMLEKYKGVDIKPIDPQSLIKPPAQPPTP